jgi:hypothetical protein
VRRICTNCRSLLPKSFFPNRSKPREARVKAVSAADVSLLLLEAGDSENASSAADRGQWLLNLNSERDWDFRAEPKPTSGRLGLASRAHAGNSLRGVLLSDTTSACANGSFPQPIAGPPAK